MLMMLMGNNSNISDILPLMMMTGGANGLTNIFNPTAAATIKEDTEDTADR